MVAKRKATAAAVTSAEDVPETKRRKLPVQVSTSFPDVACDGVVEAMRLFEG